MERGEFTIGGISSKALKAKIQNHPMLQTPRRKANRHDVPWKNGATFFDLDSYDNTEMELLLSLKSKNFADSEKNRRNLVAAFDAPGYLRFIYYADVSKAYYVRVESMTFGKVGVNGFNQNVIINLTVRPFKLEATPTPIVATTTKKITVDNPYQWESEPLISVEGNGNMMLTVNGKEFTFKNILEHIRIDSSIKQCYWMVNRVPENHNDKMFTIAYPVLKTGTNTITWTGDITKFTLEPRWNTLI